VWAWNPLKWFGKGQEGFIIGVSANTDLTNVTYFGGLYSPDFSPVAGYCSNTKYGMGGEDANNPGSFYYPAHTGPSAEDVADKFLSDANNIQKIKVYTIEKAVAELNKNACSRSQHACGRYVGIARQAEGIFDALCDGKVYATVIFKNICNYSVCF
jgi:hypothetical protein